MDTPEQSRKRKRVLVVDDDASIRSTLRKVLTNAGYDVVLAHNGLEALRLLREDGMDLVILDLFMPVQDGVETIIHFRAMGRTTPVIVISGGGPRDMDLLPEAKLLGAYYTLQKPFTHAEIMALVNSALQGPPDTSH
jgi:DNA-binding NtrC family response regulator